MSSGGSEIELVEVLFQKSFIGCFNIMYKETNMYGGTQDFMVVE